MDAFTADEIHYMRQVIQKNVRRPPGSQTSDREHVEHCLHQLIRFATQAGTGDLTPRRLAQFFLNLGRAQEILGSCGGANAWWGQFIKLVEAKDWNRIIYVVKTYLDLLGLPHPTAEFIAKM